MSEGVDEILSWWANSIGKHINCFIWTDYIVFIKFFLCKSIIYYGKSQINLVKNSKSIDKKNLCLIIF
jgi:hypothetical protein